MASGQQRKAGDWWIVLPKSPPSHYSLADQANTVCVRVQTTGSYVGFRAEVHALGATSAGPPYELMQEDGSQFWSLRIPIPAAQINSVHTGNANNTVSVTPEVTSTMLGTPDSRDFEAVSGGSGSGGSTCQDSTVTALASVLQAGRPAPVALTADFGDPGSAAGGTQARAATLIYSGAAGFERCWFSQPLDSHSDGADPALWVLERTEARTWLLRLRRGALDLVVYSHAAGEEEIDLPARLRLVGDGRVADWPPAVTLSPAP